MPWSMNEPQLPPPHENLDSKVELKFSVGIEYIRKRADVTDVWETRVDAVALIFIAGAVVLFLVFFIVPRIVGLFFPGN